MVHEILRRSSGKGETGWIDNNKREDDEGIKENVKLEISWAR